MCISLVLVVAIGVFGVGIGAPTPAQAQAGPPWVTAACQVSFLDGPKQGSTEADTFKIWQDGTLASVSNDYVGGVSTSGSWWYTDSTDTTIDYTFSASLAVPPGPGATLTVTATTAVSTTPVVATSQGTITNSNGTVLVVTHTTATCPYFFAP